MKKILLILFCFPFFGFGQQSKGYDIRPLGVAIGHQTKSNSIVISDIPIYTWHRGCGPTALGMIVGYYDLHGFSDLFTDSSFLQTDNINMLIASDEHYSDYSLPLDYYPNLLQDISDTGTPHQDNSIADFMQTKIAKDCDRKSAKLSKTLMSKDPEGNESKNVNIEKIKTTLCSTVESTEAILNGVVDVGRCYTPGKFVKLTIGIKPETIVSASRLNQNMTNSRNSSGSGSSNNSGSKSSGFNSMDGYSDYNSDF